MLIQFLGKWSTQLLPRIARAAIAFVVTFFIVLYFGWVGTWLSLGYPHGEIYYWKAVIGLALGAGGFIALIFMWIDEVTKP
jgi:hypothetical protein